MKSAQGSLAGSERQVMQSHMISGIVDLHVDSAPSLLPRCYSDPERMAVAREAVVSTVVLKAHQGSTGERAALAGQGAAGVLCWIRP